MESYQLLKTIYEISKQDAIPESYPCRPREIILRLMQDWSIIHQHLKLLEEQKMIITKQLDTLVIFITLNGIEKVMNPLNLTEPMK